MVVLNVNANNSNFLIEKEFEENGKFLKPNLRFKLKNNFFTLRDRFNKAIDLIKNGSIEQEFVLNVDDLNKLSIDFKKTVDEYNKGVKEYNTESKYIADMLKADVSKVLETIPRYDKSKTKTKKKLNLDLNTHNEILKKATLEKSNLDDLIGE